MIELYTNDARVLAVGPALLAIVAAFEVFDGIQTVSTGALRGLGETRAPMWANLVGYWVLGLPLGFFLCFGLKWGIYGLWIGLTLALVVISLALLARWKRDAERQEKVAAPSEEKPETGIASEFKVPKVLEDDLQRKRKRNS